METAAACRASPDESATAGGSSNSVSRDAASEEFRYAYIADASCAHISKYSASVAAIAGVFCPNQLVAINVASSVRLAAITGGGTVIANAVSCAVTAAAAWLAATSECAALLCSHATYGLAAATSDADAGPSHGPQVSAETTDWNSAPVECRSAASSAQAVAAANNEPEPGPLYMRPELISGGSSP